MISLSSIIQTFITEFIDFYQGSILPSQLKALADMKGCRTSQSPVMLAQCDECEKQIFVPHSCGHRNCPHCQSHESQQWLERQLKKEVPADYFLITFTLPKEFRLLAWQNQRLLYSIMIQCCWETVKTFVQNDSELRGNAGAITVLHTHSRRLDYHPHVHLVMPAGAINQEKNYGVPKKEKEKSDTFSIIKRWLKYSGPKCSTPLTRLDFSFRLAIPKHGSPIANLPAAVKKR